jgi:hypothetical protein
MTEQEIYDKGGAAAAAALTFLSCHGFLAYLGIMFLR